MKKWLCVLACVALSATAASGAAAVEVVLDDFSVDQGPVQDLVVDGSAVSGLLGNRTLTSNLLAQLGVAFNAVQVGGGVLEVDNGVGERSEVTVSFALASSLVPVGAINPSFFFTVAQSDPSGVSVKFLLNGSQIAASLIPGNQSALEISFDPPAGPIGAGDTFAFVMTGQAGWDIAIDSVGVRYTAPPIPEPSTLALAGLGALALGFSLRCRRAE